MAAPVGDIAAYAEASVKQAEAQAELRRVRWVAHARAARDKAFDPDPVKWLKNLEEVQALVAEEKVKAQAAIDAAAAEPEPVVLVDGV